MDTIPDPNALSLAIRSGNADIVGLLLDNHRITIPEDIISDIEYAVQQGYVQAVEQVINHPRIRLTLDQLTIMIESPNTPTTSREALRILVDIREQILSRAQVLETYPPEVLDIIANVYRDNANPYVLASYPPTLVEQIALYLLQHPEQVESIARDNLGMYLPLSYDRGRSSLPLSQEQVQYVLDNIDWYERILRRTEVPPQIPLNTLHFGSYVVDITLLTDYEILERTGVFIPFDSREDLIIRYRDALVNPTAFVPLRACWDGGDELVIGMGTIYDFECISLEEADARNPDVMQVLDFYVASFTRIGRRDVIEHILSS